MSQENSNPGRPTPSISNDLHGARIAALVADRFEQDELTGPKAGFELAGARVDVISPNPQMTAMKNDQAGDRFTADVALRDARADNYDALLLPGGVVNGDRLRMSAEARAFVREMDAADKPIAVICHGGWILISAELAQGHTVTSWPSLQEDFRNAGATWVDREVVQDGNWISSRNPGDIPAFTRTAAEMIAAHLHGRKTPRAA